MIWLHFEYVSSCWTMVNELCNTKCRLCMCLFLVYSYKLKACRILTWCLLSSVTTHAMYLVIVFVCQSTFIFLHTFSEKFVFSSQCVFSNWFRSVESFSDSAHFGGLNKSIELTVGCHTSAHYLFNSTHRDKAFVFVLSFELWINGEYTNDI